MNVMNIKHFLTTVTAFGLLAACSEYDPGLSDQAINMTDEELEVIKEYEANFVEHYGGVDPNHTWGFPTTAETRRTRANQPNNNEWITFQYADVNNHNTYTGYTYTTQEQLPVPGFPSYVDNLYYAQQWTGGKTQAEMEAFMRGSQGNSLNPIYGDVTDEEILYVSTWFRTHQNPVSDKCLTDNFFTQCISKDYDRSYYGEMSDEGLSTWDEVNDKDVANKVQYTGVWDKKVSIYYKDRDGNDTDRDENGNPITPGQYTEAEFQLDQLDALRKDGGEVAHIYNNNAGNTSLISSNNPTGINTQTWSATSGGGINGESYRAIMYFTDATTEDFKAFSSSGDAWNYRWVLKHLTFTGRDGKHYDGWYLAFDMKYEYVQEWYTDASWQPTSPKKVAYKDYDGYYSNYIIKITPGVGFTTDDEVQKYRIMCEDLGNTFDYDFNDLVYDVYFTENEGGSASNKYQAHITLQAVGGSYEIFIGSQDEAHNCHKLMGDSQPDNAGLYRPINVGVGKTSEPVEINDIYVAEANPDLIPIIVIPTGYAGTKNVFTLPESHEVSIAPQKICIPFKSNPPKWTREYQNIETAYPNFVGWVNAQNSEYDFGRSADWTTTNVKNNYLYNGQ